MAIATSKLDAVGIDEICHSIVNGVTLTKLTQGIGVDRASLVEWLAADSHRSARATEARRLAASAWDEKAETTLLEAKADPVEMQRARELASHYRWRSSKANPRDYGDKLQHANAAGDGNTVVEYRWADPPKAE